MRVIDVLQGPGDVTQGLPVSSSFEKMGLRTSPMGEATLHDCLVPVESRRESEGAGMTKAWVFQPGCDPGSRALRLHEGSRDRGAADRGCSAAADGSVRRLPAHLPGAGPAEQQGGPGAAECITGRIE